MKKKSFRKLSLRRETLTALDLGYATGGTVLPAETDTTLPPWATGPNTCCCTPPPTDTDVVVP